jgi:hypothetical protein
MSQREMVILANSIKNGAYCVAGKCTDNNEWVRPVSSNMGDALSYNQVLCNNPYGSFKVKPLQKVKVGFDKPVPQINQPENFLIDSSTWTQNFKINNDELTRLLDAPDSLWGEDSAISFNAIATKQINIPQSLYLVQVENLILSKSSDDKRRAKFTYNCISYDLPVTDPMFDSLIEEEAVLQGILCISLGEVFHGSCYKIVASIF